MDSESLRQIFNSLPPDRAKAFIEWCKLVESKQRPAPKPSDGLPTCDQPPDPIEQRDIPEPQLSRHTTPADFLATSETHSNLPELPEPPAPDAEPADKHLLDDRYELIELIGEGAYAKVWRAKDTKAHLTTKTQVAVKILRTEHAIDRMRQAQLRDIFRREAESLDALNHPNIVRVLDAHVTPNGDPYIVMEYLNGRVLSKELEAERVLVPERVGRLLDQLCNAVQCAHEEGILHRDLKPGNIMLVGEGPKERLKVLDFGTARFVDQAHLTITAGAPMGTPAYMSPEEHRGEGGTAFSDIYSIGVIVFEMLTGQLPFDSQSLADQRRQHCEEDPLDPCELNPRLRPELRAVILQALEKDPRLRPHTVAELARNFREALHPKPPAPENTQSRARGEFERLATVQRDTEKRQLVVAESNRHRDGEPTGGSFRRALKIAGPIALAVCTAVFVWQQLQSELAQAPKPTLTDDSHTTTGPIPISSTNDQANDGVSDDAGQQDVHVARRDVEEVILEKVVPFSDKVAGALGSSRRWDEIERDFKQEFERSDAPAADQELATELKVMCAVFQSDDPNPLGITVDKLQSIVAALRRWQGDEQLRSRVEPILDNELRSVLGGSEIRGGLSPEEALVLASSIREIKSGSFEAQSLVAYASLRRGMHPEAARAYKALVDAGFRGAQCYAGLAKAAREVLGSIPEPNQSASNQSPDLPAEAFIIVRDARRILLQPPVSVRMVGEVMKERSEFFASMIIAAVPRLGTELDFKEIEPFTNVDNGDLADDWAKGVRIEWLLGVPNAPSPSGLAAARSIVSKMKGGAGKYGDYILGLVHQAEGDSSAAATAYDQAFANLASGQPMLWQNEERRKLVASFYHTSAESRMARIGQGSVPHEIYDWYRKASEFHPQRPLRYHERTVLAGSRLAAPPWDTVEAYSSKLVQRLTELERPFEVMLANAKAHEQLENHAKQAFETYHDIAAWRLDKKEQAFTAVKPIDFYQKAVEPGIKLGNELVRPDSEPLMQVRMASLHAAKARLIRDDEPNWFDWKNLLDKPPWEAVIDAYSAAIHAHPANHTEKARYYAGRGWAKLSLGGQDLQSVLEDAQQAQRTDLNFPGGFALQGAYHQRQANRLRENYQNDAPEVMSELNKSKSSYDRATEKTGKIDDSERRIFHLNSSIAKVLYANFLYGSSKDEIRKTLNGAVEDATDACDLGRTPNTLGALGNAYEDLAWSKLGNDPTYYPKAERVFKDQVEMQQALPDASANLGRLYVKWYRDSGKQTSEYLDQARVSLENAIEIDTRLHASGGGNVAHSHYDTYRWMGELKGEQGKTGEQFDLYQQALTDPRVRRAQWHEIADLVGRDNEQKFLDAVIARPGRCPARLLIERSKLLQLRRNPTEKDFSQALADAELARTEAVDPSAAADACIAAILAKVELRNINGSTEARKAVSQYRREKIGLWLELVAHAEKGAEHPRLVGWLKELVEQMDRDYRAMPDQNEKILCLKHGVYAATVALNRDLKESDRLALERLKGQMESELKRLSRT